MTVFKYNLKLKTSFKGFITFLVCLFIFFDMKKSYLLTHDSNDPGVWLINLSIFVCFLFILFCVYSVFSRFFYHKNHRVVFKENILIIPGFLRIFKEVEIKFSEIIKIELIENREIKIIKFQLRDNRKYEFVNAMFDSNDEFITFYEMLKSKIATIGGKYDYL